MQSPCAQLPQDHDHVRLRRDSASSTTATRTCASAARAWSTKQIPAADYEAIRALDRRYRRIGWLAFGGFGLICVAVGLTRPVSLLFLIPAGMMTWFTLFRPMVRRRHWRAIQALTRRWTLRAE